MLNTLYVVIIIFVPILLDKYLNFDRMSYGIISTIFGWVGATVLILLLIETRG